MLSEKKMKKDKEIVLELETQIKGTHRTRLSLFTVMMAVAVYRMSRNNRFMTSAIAPAYMMWTSKCWGGVQIRRFALVLILMLSVYWSYWKPLYISFIIISRRNSTSAEWATAMSWPATRMPLLHGMGVTGLLPTASWSWIGICSWTWQTCETNHGSASLRKAAVTAPALYFLCYLVYADNNILLWVTESSCYEFSVQLKQKNVLFVHFSLYTLQFVTVDLSVHMCICSNNDK